MDEQANLLTVRTVWVSRDIGGQTSPVAINSSRLIVTPPAEGTGRILLQEAVTRELIAAQDINYRPTKRRNHIYETIAIHVEDSGALEILAATRHAKS